jgi:hypothetical protein
MGVGDDVGLAASPPHPATSTRTRTIINSADLRMADSFVQEMAGILPQTNELGYWVKWSKEREPFGKQHHLEYNDTADAHGEET